MGRPKKYTAKRLEAGIQEYFDSISRERIVTESAPTGQKDQYGHTVMEERPVLNLKGDQIVVTEFVVPPTEADIYTHLGLARSTWAEYCNADLHPEFSDIIAQARGRMHAHLERKVQTERHVQGLIHELDRMDRKSGGPTLTVSVSSSPGGGAQADVSLSMDEKEAVLKDLIQEFTGGDADGEDNEP